MYDEKLGLGLYNRDGDEDNGRASNLVNIVRL